MKSFTSSGPSRRTEHIMPVSGISRNGVRAGPAAGTSRASRSGDEQRGGAGPLELLAQDGDPVGIRQQPGEQRDAFADGHDAVAGEDHLLAVVGGVEHFREPAGLEQGGGARIRAAPARGRGL
jgi:hypothetical protein